MRATARLARPWTAMTTVFAAALLFGFVPVSASADSMSPRTGARATTAGTPTPGAGGTVFYVDSSAGSDANAGTTPTSAWRTLAAVTAATLAPGDVVAFKRGQTFNGSATVGEAGSAGNYITLTAFGSGTQPLLRNPGGLNMLVLDAAYVRVTDLAFADGATFLAGPFDAANYQASGAVVATINAYAADIQDSTFTNVGLGVKTYGKNSTILHNTFQNLQIAYTDASQSYGAIGVSVNNDGIRVAWNDFINCRSTNSPYGADGGAVEIEGFTPTKNDILIDHNYSKGSQGFLEVTETTTSNVKIQYNVSNDYQQFIAWDTTTPSNYVASNNTVLRSTGSRLFDQYYYAHAGPAPAANWITIRNNVFGGNAPFSFFDFPHDHNLFAPGIGLGGNALRSGDIVADPSFVNASTGDLRLQAGSAAVDNAAATSATTDLDAAATNVGVGVDMGAFERQGFLAGSASVVAEGGFETQTSVTTASGPWFGEGTHAFGVDVAAGVAHSGSDNGWTATTGTGWGALKQTVPVSANSTYRLTVWVQTSSNLTTAYLGAKSTAGAVVSEIRSGAAASYTRYVLTFSTGSLTTVNLHVGFYGTGSSTWQRVDDVQLQRL